MVAGTALCLRSRPDDFADAFGDRRVEIEFDFIAHILEVRTSSGERRHVTLEPRTVASFYGEVIDVLGGLGVRLPFSDDRSKCRYRSPSPRTNSTTPMTPAPPTLFWLALVQAHRVMTVFRARFIGKASPVHFFWGAADLAASRFSGRRAPKHPGGVPNCADWVQELAYSQEVSSCGFWPGGSAEGSFYAYAYPQPDGFDEWRIRARGRLFRPGPG